LLLLLLQLFIVVVDIVFFLFANAAAIACRKRSEKTEIKPNERKNEQKSSQTNKFEPNQPRWKRVPVAVE
jgi:hypothetical protein